MFTVFVYFNFSLFHGFLISISISMTSMWNPDETQMSGQNLVYSITCSHVRSFICLFVRLCYVILSFFLFFNSLLWQGLDSFRSYIDYKIHLSSYVQLVSLSICLASGKLCFWPSTKDLGFQLQGIDCLTLLHVRESLESGCFTLLTKVRIWVWYEIYSEKGKSLTLFSPDAFILELSKWVAVSQQVVRVLVAAGALETQTFRRV